MKKILTTCCALLAAVLAFGQTAAFWHDAGKAQSPNTPAFMPGEYRSLSLDLGEMMNFLRQAPMELTEAAKTAPLLLELPMPNGEMAAFEIWESPIMEPALAAQYPSIKTFAGKSFHDPATTVRLDFTLYGFHAIVHAAGETALISPIVQGDLNNYISYWLKDMDLRNPEAMQFRCEVEDQPFQQEDFVEQHGHAAQRALAPVDLYTYRLAVATTSEYSFAHGNTLPTILSAVTTVVNNINSVFERDAAVRMVLIANTTQTFFIGPANADPYTNGNTEEMIGENPAQMNMAYTVDGYDIGHAFGTNGGGLAQLGSVCNGNAGSQYPKARGVSCSFGPYEGSLFYIIAGHEMGHQFNAQHNFNKCDGENESPDTAYEPGSGSSIMCYNGNGVCTVNHIQATSDDYFHNNAMQRIAAFTRTGGGSSCNQVVAIGNNTPEATIPIPGGFFIPISTPFELDGAGTDTDGDDLTYSWEQYDLGPPSILGMPTGTAPLFRSYPPSANTLRVFPKIGTIVANANDITEVLPTTTRVLTFHFTVRDNHAEAGGFDFEEIQFQSTAAAGPFLVSYPNASGISLTVGDYVEVKWDVANSDLPPVNSQKVNIRLSLDGGFTYPITLLTDSDNDGSAYVVIPDEVTTTARVRVEAADNIFFDISNSNFAIVPPAQPTYLFTNSPEAGIACDEFEVVLAVEPLLGFDQPVTLAVSGLPAGATASFAPNPVQPGQSSTLTINTAGTTVTGDVTLNIVGTSAGQPDQTRFVVMNVVETDLSNIAAITPGDGASGQATLPNFTWTDLPNAITYDIQLSTDPGFATIVDSGSGLASASWTPSVTLLDSKIYYWRVRATNECGTGEFADPASFHTVSQSCFDLTSTGGNQPIPSQGTPVISSVINVPQAGTISEVLVPNVKGNHTAVGDLEFRLKGPDGTTVVLMSEPGCNSPNFNCGFSANAPLTLVNCPTANAVYKPVGDLNSFLGKNSQGDWTFECAVVNSLGEGGTFENWKLKVCAGLQPNNPFKVLNDTLHCPPNDSRLVYQDHLVIEDSDNLPSELEFTIVSNTQHGFVSLNGNTLGVGSHFTMLDVYASAVEYTNTNPAALYDYFTFTVNDGTGGFFGTPRFNIVIDPNAEPSAVNNLADNGNMLLFPNPTAGDVTVSFLRPVAGPVVASVVNMHGQNLLTRSFDGLSGPFKLETEALPSGVYLVQVRAEEGVFVRKLVVE